MVDIARILFYGPFGFFDRGFYENERDVEKGIYERRPASHGPPVVPRSSRDGSKPIAHRFQETVVPVNQRILKAMGLNPVAFLFPGLVE